MKQIITKNMELPVQKSKEVTVEVLSPTDELWAIMDESALAKVQYKTKCTVL